MVDERLNQLLGRLDEPVSPDPAFSEALFGRIAPLAVAAGRRDRTWHGRMLMAVRSASLAPGFAGPPQLRAAILLATLLALLLALAAIIGSLRPDPTQIVLGSEAVYRDPPSFDITVGYSDGAIRRFRYDGASVMRLDAVKGPYGLRPEGTYFLVDTARGRVLEWDPVGRTLQAEALPSGVRPIFQLDVRFGSEVSRANQLTSQCLSWEYVEETTVIGRPAHHVRCSTGRHEEFWVDIATGFALRSTAVPTDDPRLLVTGEVQSLDLGVTIDPALLAVDEGPRMGASMPGGDRPLEPGLRAVSNRFAPAFAVTPGEGWRSWGTAADIVGFVRGPDWNGADGAAVLVVRLTNFSDVSTGRDRPLAPGPEGVIDWLRGHPYFEVGAVVPTQVGSIVGASVAFTEIRPADFDTTCPLSPPEEEVASCWRWFPQGSGYWYYGSADHGARATVLDVGGTTITILTWAEGPDEAADLTAIDDLLASIEFLD